jgi:hypothetical protein
MDKNGIASQCLRIVSPEHQFLSPGGPIGPGGGYSGDLRVCVRESVRPCVRTFDLTAPQPLGQIWPYLAHGPSSWGERWPWWPWPNLHNNEVTGSTRSKINFDLCTLYYPPAGR